LKNLDGEKYYIKIFRLPFNQKRYLTASIKKYLERQYHKKCHA